MTLSINDDICKKYSLEPEEVLALLLIKTNNDIPSIINNLLEKKAIVRDMFNNYMLTQRWDDLLCSIMLDSDKDAISEDKVESLALKLMAIFPKEKKAGTCHYFRGNRKDNILKLKKFFKLYGNKYSEEEILEAAQNYVNSFNGNYKYMRILKYFIWKDEKKMDSNGKYYIEETSDLASCIENKGQGIVNNDWNCKLV